MITGEVFFPGEYPITENETLTDLIKRAGGITSFADTKSTVFQREELRKNEIKRLTEAQSELQRKIVLAGQTSGVGENALTADQINQLTGLLDSSSQDYDALGRLVIDLEGIMLSRTQDLELRDGDSINIPKKKQSITVIGEVYASNTHLFDGRLSVNDYLSLSGGATEFADESSIYIIKSDGSIISPSQISSGFFRSSSNDLGTGDTIVVPIKLTSFSQVRAATEISQIIYQMAVAAAAVSSF